ncbi:MAG: hypothetical protein EOP45_05100 [Sphingobacteriaceae bacterium]|nr:MAG: hypothetical protein EOP45_05100 [Sphingobacteriaceae bacterium]
MAENHPFTVEIFLHSKDVTTPVKVTHIDETFSFELEENHISIINNGDNSWSQVEGTTPKEVINKIRQAIEDYYQRQPL